MQEGVPLSLLQPSPSFPFASRLRRPAPPAAKPRPESPRHARTRRRLRILGAGATRAEPAEGGGMSGDQKNEPGAEGGRSEDPPPRGGGAAGGRGLGGGGGG